MRTKEEQKKKMRDYYLTHKDKWVKYCHPPQTEEEKMVKRLQKIKWKEEHPEKDIWSKVKYRATKEGLSFNLEINDIVVPEFCPYLELKLTSKKGNRRCDALMSLDRIDPKKGYIKGNVEVISYKANRMKNDASIQELLIFSKNIIKKYANSI